MTDIDAILPNMGFPITHDVRDRTSIGGLFRQKERCGIYILHLSGSTYYVGLSKDVTERFRQHKAHYLDIVALSFRRVRYDNQLLRSEERKLIHILDAKNIALLNKIHNTISYSSSPFDILVSPQEQRLWLDQGPLVIPVNAEERPSIQLEKLVRDRRKIAEFQLLPHYISIAEALGVYIYYTIPAYFRTEGRYWSMSCMPSTLGGWRASTISMSNMETFVIFRDGASFINIASTVFTEAFPSPDAFFQAYPGTSIEVAGYEAAGFDQISIRSENYQTTMSALNSKTVQRGARLMNLSLIRQRATLYSNSHSPGLTALALGII